MGTDYIEKYTVNLTKQVQSNPAKYKAYGRDKEIQQTRRILNQAKKNSVALLGDPGVGKTAVVEGLAVQLLEDTSIHDQVSGKQIVTLTLPNLLEHSQGSNFATNLQHLLEELITYKKEYLLFIDEMHQLIGTGRTQGSMMDAANILKPVIGRGEISIIGATTLDEFHQSIEQDGALDRRFDKIQIDQTDYDQTLFILNKVASQFEQSKGVHVSEQVLDYVYTMSDRFMTAQSFPEKSIMLLDSATTIAQLDKHSVLSKEDVATKIGEQFHMGLDFLLSDDSQRIMALPTVLKRRVIGQDDALKKIERRIRARSAGLGDMSKPLSFFLAGPTGVGKTETAKALAEVMFGSEDKLIRFDMSEFKFAKQSMMAFKERVTEAVKFHPYSVLLLDEVEKGDPLVLDLLLQILDDGRLTNDLGKVINFKDLIVIMTSNIGHDVIEDFADRAEAYKQDKKNQQNFKRNFETRMLGAGMRQEFIKRIGSLILFEPLKEEAVLAIIDQKLNRLKKKAAEQGYQIVTDLSVIGDYIPSIKEGWEAQVDAYGRQVKAAVHPVREFIMDKGYKRTDGARPLDETINEYVEDAVAEAILMERITGKSPGHTFLFRAVGQAPDATHAMGTWKTIFSQLETPAMKGEVVNV